MSSASIFVPGAFGVLLQPPKEKQSKKQKKLTVCAFPGCKQQFNAGSSKNKIFYKKLLGQNSSSRRDLCPIHSSLDSDSTSSQDSNSLASSSNASRANASTDASSNYPSSSSTAAVVQTAVAASSIADYKESAADKNTVWRDTPVPTTFTFGSAPRTVTRESWTAGLQERLRREYGGGG